MNTNLLRRDKERALVYTSIHTVIALAIGLPWHRIGPGGVIDVLYPIWMGQFYSNGGSLLLCTFLPARNQGMRQKHRNDCRGKLMADHNTCSDLASMDADALCQWAQGKHDAATGVARIDPLQGCQDCAVNA